MTDRLKGQIRPFAGDKPAETTVNDLSECAQQLLNEPDQAGGAPCVTLPCCPPEAVTLQIAPQPDQHDFFADFPCQLPAYIANAQKGDLFLCPGGSMGMIGGLLGALDPPQHYTHMGIFIDDGRTIRHCTMSDEQVNDAIGGAGDLVGKLALHEAFSDLQTRPLQYGWPGTITQTVDSAWRSQRDKAHVPQDEQFHDAGVTQNLYVISALSFYPERASTKAPSDVPGGTAPVIEPLVVQPCPALEGQTPGLRDLLHRIADAAIALRCHYRFFSYSKADIAFDPGMVGPVVFETTRPDPHDPCGTVPVTETVPAVCSTLVWTAARIVANESKPALLLDPAATRGMPGHDTGPCQNSYRLSGGAVPANEDGLYAYREWQRQKAGQTLHDGLEQQVKEAFAEFMAWGTTKAHSSILKYVSVLLDILQSIIDFAVTKPLEAILDVQGRLADIICNLFAYDDPMPSARWKTPGDGVSVSPDDLASWWQENRMLSDSDCQGVYGHTAPARFRPPMTVSRPPQKWTISQGPGALEGLVRLDGDHRIPIGAVVEVACRSAVANADGWFHLDAPQGTYLITGHWFDPDTTWVWEGSAVVDVPFWATLALDLHTPLLLSPPPEGRRRVRVLVHSDVVNRHTFGHDWWDHRDSANDLYLMDQNAGAERPDNPAGRYPYNSSSTGAPVEDIGVANVDYWIHWAPQPTDPFAVRFVYASTLREHDDYKTGSGPQEVIVGSVQSVDIHIEMSNQELAESPEHVWFTLHVTNERMP